MNNITNELCEVVNKVMLRMDTSEPLILNTRIIMDYIDKIQRIL